ncbi:hypothetical protein GCM10018953_71630 [Streptosporangium nondiastaticum]
MSIGVSPFPEKNPFSRRTDKAKIKFRSDDDAGPGRSRIRGRGACHLRAHGPLRTDEPLPRVARA